MAKTIKYCADCECSHAMGECGSETPTKREKMPRVRDRNGESYFEPSYYPYSDPMSMDP